MVRKHGEFFGNHFYEFGVYLDSEFETNDSLSSKVGYLIIQRLLDYSIKKPKRIIGSIMGAEVWDFSNAFNQAFITKMDMYMMIAISIQIQMYKDSKKLLDSVKKGKNTTAVLLIFDLLFLFRVTVLSLA